MHILILYSTVDGHTRKICEQLGAHILACAAAGAVQVTLADLSRDEHGALADYDKIVLGASIRYGRYRQEVHRFIREHHAALAAVPSAFFSVNLVARKPNRQTPQENPYARKLLNAIPWRPDQAAVFAGRLDYPACSTFDRHIIRCIMWLTGGPTDPNAIVEFTDWDAVARFGKTVATM